MKMLFTPQKVFCYVLSLYLYGGSVPTYAHDGTVHISGTIKSNTCTVTDESRNQTVQLGRVADKRFFSVGDASVPQQFIIKLQDCGAAVREVTVTFSGDADTNNPNLLKVDGGSGAASGVGVAILDREKKIIALNAPSESYSLSPHVDAILLFFSQYISTSVHVTPGKASALATFKMTYE